MNIPKIQDWTDIDQMVLNIKVMGRFRVWGLPLLVSEEEISTLQNTPVWDTSHKLATVKKYLLSIHVPKDLEPVAFYHGVLLCKERR